MNLALYLAFFGFTSAPFGKEVSDADLWLPPSKQDVVDGLCEAADEHECALLLGEPGWGKTCVLRAVRQRFADQAAAALGAPPLAPFTVPGATSGSSRTAAGDSLSALLARPDPVTAVAAFDDDVALRVLAAMRALGLSAPGDLAVIGFDDNGYGALATPALTTVHIDAEAHGRQAARAILGLNAADLAPVPGTVVVRESA